MAKMMDDDYNPNAGADLKWDQFCPKYKWKKGWQRIRLYGLVYQHARHNNIKTKSNKAYNEFCLGYDVDNDRFYSDKEARCACCALGLQYQMRYFVNIVAVDEWEKRPSQAGSVHTFDDPGAFYLAELAPSLHQAIMGLKALNGGANVGDPRRGAIIGVNYNPDAPSPAQTYSVSMIQANYVFTEQMRGITLSQSTPQGTREIHKGSDLLPPAWVYYPCCNTKEKQEKSLRNHGYYGTTTSGASETHADVEAKGKALLNELSGMVKEGDQKPRVGVKELAKLRENEDNTPPPKPAKAQAPADDAVDVEDQIPF